MGKTALFLAGGAPNMTLVSGALLALHEEWVEKRGQKFDIITMAGAGAVIGLMYLCPKGLTQKQALYNTMNFGVSDLIYSMLPINYKVFAKSGPSAQAFMAYWYSLPEVQAATHQYGMTPAQKLYADWILFLGSALCPTDLNYFDAGYCDHPAYVSEFIDFCQVPHIEPYIEVNAFRLDGPEDMRGPCDFRKHEITVEHLRGALAFPFIYPPYRIGEYHYFEGAAFQVVNPLNLPEGTKMTDIDNFIVLNPMHRKFISYPRNIWDAYAQSVMMPLAALAEYGLDQIQDEFRQAMQAIVGNREPLGLLDGKDIRIPVYLLPHLCGTKRWKQARFDKFVPEERVPYVFDWTRSNMEFLFCAGYEAGKELASQL